PRLHPPPPLAPRRRLRLRPAHRQPPLTLFTPLRGAPPAHRADPPPRSGGGGPYEAWWRGRQRALTSYPPLTPEAGKGLSPSAPRSPTRAGSPPAPACPRPTAPAAPVCAPVPPHSPSAAAPTSP